MQIDLAFGKTGISVDLPEGYRYGVLQARTATPLPDCQSALESALDRPIGALPLAELARGKTSAAISVCWRLLLVAKGGMEELVGATNLVAVSSSVYLAAVT